jgi:hypothetical protein
MTTRFRIDNVRVDWNNLFKGEQYQGTGSYRCGATLIIPPDHPQFKQVEDATLEAATIKWKDKAAARLKAARAKDNVALRDGDIKGAKSEGYEGNFYISAACKGAEVEAECEKPTVYTRDRVKVTNPADNPIYRGCYVNALVEFYAMDQYGDQVNCKLVGIQFAKDGDAFGSAPARPDDFDVVEGAEASDFA